jgi:hypothetical protein
VHPVYVPRQTVLPQTRPTTVRTLERFLARVLPVVPLGVALSPRRVPAHPTEVNQEIPAVDDSAAEEARDAGRTPLHHRDSLCANDENTN